MIECYPQCLCIGSPREMIGGQGTGTLLLAPPPILGPPAAQETADCKKQSCLWDTVDCGFPGIFASVLKFHSCILTPSCRSTFSSLHEDGSHLAWGGWQGIQQGPVHLPQEVWSRADLSQRWWWFLFSREVVSSSLQPHGLQHARLPCPSVCQSLLRLMSIELMMPSNHLIVCCPFILLPLPDVFPRIRVFSNGSVLCTSWPECFSFSFSISPSNEFSGLISFRIDWFDPAVQGTLRSLLQHHSWKASIHWRSAFFMVQLSHPYMTTGKIIALTIWTFVNKVMSLICCLGLA